MSKRLEEVIETVRVNQWFEKEYKALQENHKNNNEPFINEEAYQLVINFIANEVLSINYSPEELHGNYFSDANEALLKCCNLIKKQLNEDFNSIETLICEINDFWLIASNKINLQLFKETEGIISSETATSDFVQILINHNSEKSKIYFHRNNSYSFSEFEIDTSHATKVREFKVNIDNERMKERSINMQKKYMQAIFFYTKENEYYEKNEEHQFICVLLDRIYQFILRNNLNIDEETFAYILNVLLVEIDDEYSSIYTSDVKQISINDQLKNEISISTFFHGKELSKIRENEIFMIDSLVGACLCYFNDYKS